MNAEEPTTAPIKDLPTAQRVDLLLQEYPGGLRAVTLCIDHEEVSLPLQEGYQVKFPYIAVKVETQDPEHPTALLTTPVNPEDANMIFRLGRSAVMGQALTESTEEGAQEIVEFFRIPAVLAVRQATHKDKGIFVGSMMQEWIDTKSVGSTHLAEPGAFTRDDMLHMAQLFKLIQKVGRPFTKGEDWYHSHISDPWNNHDTNKWWIDIKNPARLEVYRREFGQDFIDRLGELLRSDETAELFAQEETYLRVCVLGNIIPSKLGKDADGRIVLRDLERTAYTQQRAFDYATFLVTLISDSDRLEEFMRFSMELNPDPGFLRHLRRSILLDRLGNLVDLVKDPANEQVVKTFKQLATDALNQTGLFDPARYHLVKESI